MATFISHSPEETESFAEGFGRRAKAGLVIGLIGDLGAGKTQFVKGFARGLGVTERVLSPTFALLHVYISGRLPLYHLDLYRLNAQQEIVAAGLEEYLTGSGVAVVEWWNHWQGVEPASVCHFQFDARGDKVREVTYEDPGA
jgi:tRNA threonylcarbamoyladenosine biosynthesis protein TsaE